LAALEDIIKTGADRILTSGQQKSALTGKELLKTIVEKAGERIIILAGAGINPDNVSEIISFTGANEIHASCSINLERKTGFVSSLDAENTITLTDDKIVNQIASLLKNHSKL